MLTARSCNTVLLFWKKIHFLKCCIFSESHQVLVTRVLILDRLRTVRESAWQNFMQCILLEPVKVCGKKLVFELSTHFQFSHSNSFILSRQVLCWPCFDRFSSYGRRSRRTRLLFAKNNWFRFSSVIIIIIIIIIHVYTGDLPATNVDAMGGPVIIKY